MKLTLHHNSTQKGIKLPLGPTLKKEEAATLAALGFRQNVIEG